MIVWRRLTVITFHEAPSIAPIAKATITTGHKSRVWCASYVLSNNGIYVPRGSAGDWQKWYYENADAATVPGGTHPR